MEYAIVEILGKQYQVTAGQKLVVDRLPGEVGSKLQFNTVLLHATGDTVTVGNPYVAGIALMAKVVGHTRGKKILVLRFRAKSHYHKSRGHRQEQSELVIESIASSAKKAS